MSSKKHLMRTASVTGAAVAAAAFPLAADAADPIPVETNDYGYFLSLEGGALFGDSAFDKVGISESGDNFDDELGFRGAAAFGQQFDNGWDWRIGVAVSQFNDNDAFVSSGASFEAEYESDIDYETADLEIGYRPDHGGNFDLRMFAGLRLLHSEDSLDKLGQFGFSDVSTEFLGIGPRAGIDFSARMQDSMLGFSGMAAGAVIFGEREEEEEFNIFSAGSDESDEDATIYNIEAALGLDLHLSEASKVTIGYRGEYWQNMVGSEDKLGIGSAGVQTDEDLLVHGPFLRFLSEF